MAKKAFRDERSGESLEICVQHSCRLSRHRWPEASEGVIPGNADLCLSTVAFSQDCDWFSLYFIVPPSIQGCSEKLHNKTEELVWLQLVLVPVVHCGFGLVVWTRLGTQ